jgi:hypothetical protein
MTGNAIVNKTYLTYWDFFFFFESATRDIIDHTVNMRLYGSET